MEVRPEQWNKTEFIPNHSIVNTTLRMHHINADKTYWEKARRELHKNTMNYVEQILEATLYKTTAVQPLNSYF